MDKPILQKDGATFELGINIRWFVAVRSHPSAKAKYSYAIAQSAEAIKRITLDWCIAFMVAIATPLPFVLLEF